MQQPQPRKKVKIIWRGFIIRLIILFFVGLFSVAGFYGYKVFQFQKKITQPPPPAAPEPPATTVESLIKSAKSLVSGEKIPLKGEDRGRINVLLLGMGGEGHSGKYLTDTIILASFNPKTYQSALLSLPRDLYVDIPEMGIATKINAVYAYGMNRSAENSPESVEKIKQVVSEVTGQEVDYYLILNFDGFQQIIDELGGIDLEVPEDILDTRYPGPNFSYQTFEINHGFHHLDGETALKYARVRHTNGGDFGRAARQQQILAATKKKALSLGTILNPARMGGFIDTLGDNLKTDIQLHEIPSFIHIANNVNIYQTTNKVLDAWNPDSLLSSTHLPLGGAMAYVLLPRAKNYSQIRELATNIFDLSLVERKKQSIKDEAATIGVVVSPRENRSKVTAAFRKLGYEKIRIVSNSLPGMPECSEATQIFHNSNRSALFTLDDLAGKFEAQVQDQPIENFDEDVVVCLSDDAIDYFNQQNENVAEEDETLKEQSVLDNRGDIRFNEKK